MMKMNKETLIALPITSDFMLYGDMRMISILLYNYDWCKPFSKDENGNTKPYKRLSKYDYKNNKRKMIELYGCSSQYWNRQFKKMIELGFIEEDVDHYKVYNKSKDNNWFTLIPRTTIVKAIESKLSAKHLKLFIKIFSMSWNTKLKSSFEVQINLAFLSTTIGLNPRNATRDLIGEREVGSYCEGCGLLTKLEEEGFIEIDIRKEQFTNFNNNKYYFKAIIQKE